jgi:RHS repeat-associated protein
MGCGVGGVRSRGAGGKIGCGAASCESHDAVSACESASGEVTSDLVRLHTNSGAREYDPVVGRWVEKDPIRWGGGTTGLYECCYGAPIGLADPSGAKPGDVYKSSMDAVFAALNEHNPLSARGDREYAGIVYERVDGTFGFTVAPQRKGDDKFTSWPFFEFEKLAPACARPDSMWHTHPSGGGEDFSGPGASPLGSDFENFFAQQEAARELGHSPDVPFFSFLGTPSGRMGMMVAPDGTQKGGLLVTYYDGLLPH